MRTYLARIFLKKWGTRSPRIQALNFNNTL